MTKYSVTVGDSVWTALYSYIDTTYPNIETNVSDYSIKGVYEEDSQKFTILQNNKDGKYYRLNFSLDENNEFSASPDLIEVTDYAANEESQFSEDSINEFVNEFKKKRDDKESKNEEKSVEGEGDTASAEKKDDEKSESNNSEEKSEEEKEDHNKKGKKVKYDLNEIQEYVDLKNEYDALKTKYDEMEVKFAILQKFKEDADREAKREMIDSFYMLSDNDKADCLANIDTYSLDDIEAKLSIICVRNKVSFAREDEEPAADDVITYNLNDTSDEDSVPAWIKALRSVAKEINN